MPSITGGADPVDLVAVESLTTGDYHLQNIGDSEIRIDRVATQPGLGDDSNIVPVLGSWYFSVSSGDNVWAWSRFGNTRYVIREV